jgi:hypothetical protein
MSSRVRRIGAPMYLLAEVLLEQGDETRRDT